LEESKVKGLKIFMLKFIIKILLVILFISLPLGYLLGRFRKIPQARNYHNYIDRYRNDVLSHVHSGDPTFDNIGTSVFNLTPPPVSSKPIQHEITKNESSQVSPTTFEKKTPQEDAKPKENHNTLGDITPLFGSSSTGLNKNEKVTKEVSSPHSEGIFTAESVPSTTEVAKKSEGFWNSLKSFIAKPFHRSKKVSKKASQESFDEVDSILQSPDTTEDKAFNNQIDHDLKDFEKKAQKKQQKENTKIQESKLKPLEKKNENSKMNNSSQKDLTLPSVDFLSKDLLKLDQ
jgi:hypothetical protein